MLLVPGLTGWNHMQGVELQLVNGRLRQRHMGSVRRVKGTTKQTDSVWP
jgi:hypothetical protein